MSHKEDLRIAVVHFVLACRAEFLQLRSSNPLTHWNRLQDRLRSACATAHDAQSFVTTMSRGLQLRAPGDYRAWATQQLARAAGGMERWIDLVEEEHGYLIAVARIEAERRQNARTAGAAAERRNDKELRTLFREMEE